MPPGRMGPRFLKEQFREDIECELNRSFYYPAVADWNKEKSQNRLMGEVGGTGLASVKGAVIYAGDRLPH
jgi:hypothetical protein